MSSLGNVLVVLGSGPGIGLATAKLFSKNRAFAKIAMVSRNPERLAQEAEEVKAAGGGNVEVTAYPTDLGNIAQLRKTLAQIEQLGPVGTIFYNAARINPTEVLSTSVDELEEDFRITNSGLYVTAQWGIPLLQKSGHHEPAFLVTNTFLVESPLPFLLSLSAVKASQQNMVQNLHALFGGDIHFALFKILGVVSPDTPSCNPDNIAKTIVRTAEQVKGTWELMVEIPA
ncbi:hypothetical protein LTR78_010075 [Recurvomyces mirabilis]|uniref:Uncharacterized protein n=1 Tax=Recurvomyces mirabilis TaxID=574656 RepID=A0AAE0WGC0_9PEZI|nr:hypothetical protein LTR78_010075 [Recurvomyces mirabilis]KAK5159819.1 hypothetical protein LTS14_001924 [Recurvomyces mirabilis]